MKKCLVVFVALLVFTRWRNQRLEAWDRQHGHGAYAPVQPAD